MMVIFVFLGFCLAFAGQKTITLPKGTKAEKIGAGHFKFILPDGSILEVKNFNPRTGIIGDCGVYESSGRLISKGKQGKLQGQAKSKVVTLPPGTEYVMIDDDVTWIKNAPKASKSDYIMIDDDPTWLPATLQLEEEISNVNKLSPQPDPPGRKLK